MASQRRRRAPSLWIAAQFRSALRCSLRRSAIVCGAPFGGSGKQARCWRERRGRATDAWRCAIKIVGSQTPGESAERAEYEVNATVNSNDGGDSDDRWTLKVFVPTLAAQRQASMRKGPN